MSEDLKRKLSRPSERNFSNVKKRPQMVVREGSWLMHPLWYDYGWKEKLEELGITWTDFKGIYDSVRFHFLRWKENEESWDNALERLIEEIQEKVISEKENDLG